MPTTVEVVESFLAALKSRDPASAPLADNILYETPLQDTPLRGRDKVIRHLQVYLPALDDLKVIRHITEGNHVATLWRAQSAFGVLYLFSYFRVKDDLIAEWRNFFDPRPFLEAMAAEPVA